MIHPTALLIALATLLAASPAAAAEKAAASKAPPAKCSASLSGAHKAKFSCLMDFRTVKDKHYLIVQPTERIPDVVTFQPGNFELPGPPAVRTYTWKDLPFGLVTFPMPEPDRTLYVASNHEFNTRGEVTLTLTSVTKDKAGNVSAHGTYRAKLIPAGAGKKGELVLEARF